MADAEVPSALSRPAVRVAVVMERETAPNRWEDWRFRIAEVVPVSYTHLTLPTNSRV